MPRRGWPDHPRASPAFGELAQSWPQFSRRSSQVERVRRSVASSAAISCQCSARQPRSVSMGSRPHWAIDGPEVQVLKDCLSRAKRSAQERPLAVQISQTELYFEAPRSAPLSWCATSTLVRSTTWMVGDWKSSLTDSFCGEAPNWQLTPLWCPPSGGWDRKESRSTPGWCCSGGSTKNEGAQVPRAGRQRGTCTPRGGRSRSGEAVLC